MASQEDSPKHRPLANPSKQTVRPLDSPVQQTVRRGYVVTLARISHSKQYFRDKGFDTGP